MDFRRVWTGAPFVAALLLAGCGDGGPATPRQAGEQHRAALQAAIADDPDDIARRVALARVAIRLGDGVGAEAAVKGALGAGANDAALRPLLARAYAMQGEGARALDTLEGGPVIPEMMGEAAWVAAWSMSASALSGLATSASAYQPSDASSPSSPRTRFALNASAALFALSSSIA